MTKLPDSLLHPLCRVRRSVRARRRGRQRPRGVILLYHRVTNLASDPQLLSVRPEHFEAHMEVLRRLTRPMPLDAVAAEASGGERMVSAVTFDDGYMDNYTFARPILERHGVPATFFVSSGYVDTRREFWWDDLERLLLAPLVLPSTLELRVGRNHMHWRAIRNDGFVDKRWDVRMPPIPRSRAALYVNLLDAVAALHPAEREDLLDQLAEWTGLPREGRENYRPMTRQAVRELGRGDLFAVGAHTVTHPVLSQLRREESWAEIRDSKTWFSQLLGRDIASFAYPIGGRRSFDTGTVRQVRKAGFSLACTSGSRALFDNEDPFELPRFGVRDWCGREFETRLRALLDL